MIDAGCLSLSMSQVPRKINRVLQRWAACFRYATARSRPAQTSARPAAITSEQVRCLFDQRTVLPTGVSRPLTAGSWSRASAQVCPIRGARNCRASDRSLHAIPKSALHGGGGAHNEASARPCPGSKTDAWILRATLHLEPDAPGRRTGVAGFGCCYRREISDRLRHWSQ
jgi:hypothetical protein